MTTAATLAMMMGRGGIGSPGTSVTLAAPPEEPGVTPEQIKAQEKRARKAKRYAQEQNT